MQYRSHSGVNAVVKLGGSTLADTEIFDAALSAISTSASTGARLLIVPGGGPFADTVRETDRRLRLSDGTAHWLGVMAMDQFAYVVAERLEGGAVIMECEQIAGVLDEGQIPVLAPSRWLRQADPLPHSWDVTSDSIAAWVAGQVGASQLVLIKPSGSRPPGVDPYFPHALQEGIAWSVVPANHLNSLPGLIASSAG